MQPWRLTQTTGLCSVNMKHVLSYLSGICSTEAARLFEPSDMRELNWQATREFLNKNLSTYHASSNSHLSHFSPPYKHGLVQHVKPHSPSSPPPTPPFIFVCFLCQKTWMFLSISFNVMLSETLLQPIAASDWVWRDQETSKGPTQTVLYLR